LSFFTLFFSTFGAVTYLVSAGEAGSAGILPKDVLPQVEHYGLKYWHVTRRIKRINRKLERKIGKRAAEKRGLRWALTDFMFDNWSGEKEDEFMNVL